MRLLDNSAEQQGRAILAGIAGNVVEWYDFTVYGYFAAVIGRQFFPAEDPISSLLAAFGVFAAGFLMRPFGSLVFGHIGDKIGRKAALMASVILMAVPTFLIGFRRPTRQIGYGSGAAGAAATGTVDPGGRRIHHLGDLSGRAIRPRAPRVPRQFRAVRGLRRRAVRVGGRRCDNHHSRPVVG
jgi:hypothetical protein